MFARYRYDKTDETGSGDRRPNTRERGRDAINRPGHRLNYTAILSHRAVNEARVQFARHFRRNNVTRCRSTRRTRSTGRRPTSASRQPAAGRTENRWQFINNFCYTRGAHDSQVRSRLQPLRAETLLQEQHRRHVHVRDRPALRRERPDDLPDPVHAEYRRSEPFRANDLCSGLFVAGHLAHGLELTLNLGLRYDRENAFKRQDRGEG